MFSVLSISMLQVKFPHQKEAATRKIFGGIILLITAISLAIAALPLTKAYSALPVWEDCNGYFVRNNFTSYALGTVSLVAILVSRVN